MLIKKSLNIYEKLSFLASSAKFDVSSGSDRVNRETFLSKNENISKFGICYSRSSFGRCIALLKVLLTNFCINDCAYCINRKRNDIPRTILTPEELAKVTYEFYRRKYIEGLFLSSGVIGNSDKTMELMITTVKILRLKYGFNHYIHLKIIPDSSESAILEAIKWADRVSINLELPTEKSLSLLAPDKKMSSILKIIDFIKNALENLNEKQDSYNIKGGGQSTQIIIGATPDSDYQILKLSNQLYSQNKLRRVYYSGYIPINEDPRLPAITKPPLMREYRLYQADWLIRFYGFNVDEIVSEESPYLNEEIDPKLQWASKNIHLFPVEITKAPLEMLLRVPGVGLTSAQRIIKFRKITTLNFEDLKKLGVVIKRAKYFITLNGKSLECKNLESKINEIKQYRLPI